MRILHVFRTPVGGLFRHVRDLVRGQTELGHDVGILCDSSTGGPASSAALEALAPKCALGIERLPISRLPGLGDLAAARRIAEIAARRRPTVLHGHGAKGGLYARLAAARLGLPSVYTPHGGTLHYDWRSPQGAVYLATEKWLRARGSGFIFVCDFERSAFARKIGLNGRPHTIIHNGLWPEEFAGIKPGKDASDLLFIGELRKLKGVDVLIDAIAFLNRERRVSATIVGDGADREQFEAQARTLGLANLIRFTGAMPAAQAMALGRIFVMPSRAESFPYVVLETAAAGLPIVASRVGGIPEILPEASTVKPGDPKALAGALRPLTAALPKGLNGTRSLQSLVREKFDAAVMSRECCSFYKGLSAP